MAATDVRDILRPQRPGGLRLGAVLAIGAHVLLIVGLAIGVNWRSSEPEGVTAELWAASPQIAAPAPQAAPEPKPEPRPEPKPEPPPPKAEPQPDREAEIALEKAKRDREAKQRADDERRRKEAKEKAEQLAKDKADREKADREKAEQAQKERADKLAKEKAAKAAEAAIAKQREENLKRMLGQAGATGAPTSTGTAAQTAGPSASYAGRIAARVKPNIVFSDDVPGNPSAEVEVRAAPDGTILSRTLRKSSGVKAWDDAVLRAIDRTEVLPRDTDGRVPSSITIAFRLRDLAP